MTLFRSLAARRLASSSLMLLLLGISTACNASIKWKVTPFYEGDGHKSSLGPTVLATRDHGDGATTKYSISGQTKRFPHGSSKLQGALLLATNETVELPFLGLDATSVDNATAEQLGIEPWRGVLVSKVEPDSAAAEAGLKRADLLLSFNGVALASQPQFADLVAETLQPGEVVEVEISRPKSEFVREDLTVSLVVGKRTVEETAADRLDLPLDVALVQHAGLGVLTVPAEYAEDLYGQRAPAAVVAAVITGSPAYRAGFRAGDRVLSANGIPVSTAAELSEVAERGSDQLDLQVEGPLGSHRKTFDLSADLTDEANFHIPILVDYEARPDRRRLSVLDFIFQFGFNKRSDYLLSSTRSSRKSSFLSILPLGMFEFERTPTRSTNRIFWLIKWSSKR
ncbi:PDZ domain-containing protein [Saltatorellus ferox]